MLDSGDVVNSTTTEGGHEVHISNYSVGENGLTLRFPSNYQPSQGSIYDQNNLQLSQTPKVTITGGNNGGNYTDDVNFNNENRYYTISASNGWKIDIDRLVKSDDDGEYIYYVEEVGVNDNTQTPDEAGYSVSYENNNGIVGGTGNTEQDTIKVTNSEKPGSLEVTKKVTGINDTSTYSIAVKGPNEHYYSTDGTDKGTEPFYVTFNKNDTKKWINLPAGLYTVEERDASVTGYTWRVTGTGEVEVPVGDTAETEVINIYEEPQNGSLTVTKIISGVDAKGTYRIAVKDASGHYYGLDGSDKGTSAFYVDFRKDQSETWQNLPTGTFTIEEENEEKDGYTWSVTGTGNVTVNANQTTTATVTNTYTELPGSLKIQKIVNVNNSAPINKAQKTLVAGNYEFTIASTTLNPMISKKITVSFGDDGVATTVSGADATLDNGIVTVNGLIADEYTITETAITNGTSLLDTSVTPDTGTVDTNKTATVTVTAGDTAAVPVVTFTNNINTTNLSVKKEWADGTPESKKNDVTFEVWQRVLIENGDEQVEIADRPILTGITLPADGTPVPVNDLPLQGMETYDGNKSVVSYDYHIEENVPDGFYERYMDGTDPGDVIILNTPYGEIDETVDIPVKKQWMDSSNHDASDYHTDDQIQFTLTKKRVDTEAVQVNVVYRNGNGSQYGNLESFFVKKGTVLDFSISKPKTPSDRPYAAVFVNNNEKGRVTGSEAKTGIISSGEITENSNIVVSLGYNGTLGAGLNEWGKQTELEYVLFVPYATWTSQMSVKGNTGLKYDTKEDLLTEMDGVDEPSRITYDSKTYTMKLVEGDEGDKRTVISGPDNVFNPVDNQIWSAIAADMPRLERTDEGNYYSYSYSISELNITHNGNTEVVKYDNEDSRKGESTSFEVTLGEDGLITNKEKDKKAILKILKVDNSKHEKKLEKAEFTLRKIESDATTVNLESKSTEVGSGSTDKNGTLSFLNLSYGYYELSETKAPAGYIFTSDEIYYFKVTRDGIKLVQKSEDRTIQIKDWEDIDIYGDIISFEYDTSKETVDVTVGNTPGASLPSTGGFGTKLLYTLGSILVFLSGALLLIRRRRLTPVRVRNYDSHYGCIGSDKLDDYSNYTSQGSDRSMRGGGGLI